MCCKQWTAWLVFIFRMICCLCCMLFMLCISATFHCTPSSYFLRPQFSSIAIINCEIHLACCYFMLFFYYWKKHMLGLCHMISCGIKKAFYVNTSISKHWKDHNINIDAFTLVLFYWDVIVTGTKVWHWNEMRLILTKISASNHSKL